MNYIELLSRLHTAMQPAVYLEIGVEFGAALGLSRSRTIGIGPAPNFGLEGVEGKPWVKLYQQTSDQFFRTHAREATLEGYPLDLAFVDGLHEFAQVALDLENIERWSHTDTIVVIHDVLPSDVQHASRSFRHGGWTGDVWRIVPFLREHRPDLQCQLVDTGDSGALVVSQLNPNHPGMAEHADTLDRDFPADGREYERLVEAWIADAAPIQPEALLRELPIPSRLIDYAVETSGWMIGPDRWLPGKDRATEAFRVIFRNPIRGAQRVWMALTAAGMSALRFRIQSESSGNSRQRDVLLDVTHPGALHHDLDSLWFHADSKNGLFELDWEAALGPDETLTAIGLAPVAFDLRQTKFAKGMSLDLRRLDVSQIVWPRPGTRHVPERFPDRPFIAKCGSGRRDAVVFAWWIPDNPEAYKVAQFYLGLLRYHHPDSKIFLGINHGSDPTWTQALQNSGLDVQIALVRPEIQVNSDVGGFLAALEAFWHSAEPFDLVWFGHTKGASRGSYDEYVSVRFHHQRKFWSRRADVDQIFADPKIGLFSHRYGLRDLGDASIPDRADGDTAALKRIYRDTFAPLGLTAWETVFVMRDQIVRAFCDAVGDDFFSTDPADWGADRWWFEGGFPSIASMQSFEPYIELDTDGGGSARVDLALFDDPRQSNRLAMEELQRWREDPYCFQQRSLPKGYD